MRNRASVGLLSMLVLISPACAKNQGKSAIEAEPAVRSLPAMQDPGDDPEKQREEILRVLANPVSTYAESARYRVSTFTLGNLGNLAEGNAEVPPHDKDGNFRQLFAEGDGLADFAKARYQMETRAEGDGSPSIYEIVVVGKSSYEKGPPNPTRESLGNPGLSQEELDEVADAAKKWTKRTWDPRGIPLNIPDLWLLAASDVSAGNQDLGSRRSVAEAYVTEVGLVDRLRLRGEQVRHYRITVNPPKANLLLPDERSESTFEASEIELWVDDVGRLRKVLASGLAEDPGSSGDQDGGPSEEPVQDDLDDLLGNISISFELQYELWDFGTEVSIRAPRT